MSDERGVYINGIQRHLTTLGATVNAPRIQKYLIKNGVASISQLTTTKLKNLYERIIELNHADQLSDSPAPIQSAPVDNEGPRDLSAIITCIEIHLRTIRSTTQRLADDDLLDLCTRLETLSTEVQSLAKQQTKGILSGTN